MNQSPDGVLYEAIFDSINGRIEVGTVDLMRLTLDKTPANSVSEFNLALDTCANFRSR